MNTAPASRDAITWSATVLIFLEHVIARRRHIEKLQRDLEDALADWSYFREFSLILADSLREEIAQQQRLLEAERDNLRAHLAREHACT